MRALKMTFGGSNNVAVAWDAEVSGFEGLSQKVVNGVMTQAGSDELVTGRGTNALKELAGHGAYDLMAIQHTLNFAAQKSYNDVLQFESAADPTEQIKSVRMRLAGIVQNVAQATIVVSNRAGEINNDNLELA
jgi:hypothetical protein